MDRIRKGDFMGNYVDLTGEKFGKLEALRKVNPHITSGGRYITMWECRCGCGNIAIVSSQKLRNGHTTSCGCNKQSNKGGRFSDLTGRKFGRLTVLKYLDLHERTDKRKCWLCQCECGEIKSFAANKLINGTTLSCGCLKSERLANLNKKYQYANKRLYSIYAAMLERCYNKKNKEYKNYGGRGIKVCEEWEENYDKFAAWAFSNGYNVNAKRGECTIDRINVNLDYSPANCRWISNTEQQNNKRRHIFVTYDATIYTLADLARKLAIPYSFMRYRYVERNMSIQEIIDNYAALK